MPNGPRADRLDRAAFTSGLLKFVAERGLGELSMRSLGQALGVSHMAVYHHFPGGREQLLQVTADAVIAGIKLPEFRGDWIAWLVTVSEGTFEALNKYPGVAEYVLARHPVYITQSAATMIDNIFAILLDSGMSELDAAEVWIVCETWLAGQLWIADATRNRPSTSASDLRRIAASLGKRSAVRRVAPFLTKRVANDHLSSGLRDLLIGFSQRG